MPERSVVSWNSLLKGYVKCGDIDGVRRGRVGLDQVALVSALSACAEIGDLKLGKWIPSYVEEKFSVGREPVLVSLNNALIHMAILVFFEWMRSLGVKEARLDELTFLGDLSACSHGGFVDEDRQFFECMNQNWGIKPRIEHYGCMADLFSRAGLLDEAFSLVQNMPMKPNDAVIRNNAELASQVAQKSVAEIDPEQAAGYLALLANVYATAKKKMIKLGVRKPPGRSWVQINGVLLDYVGGDSAHKHASLIYKMLGEITMQAMREGYNPDLSELFLGIKE
ncbi:hypothetical protein WN943_013991 [Citrus x changshan-huyou]